MKIYIVDDLSYLAADVDLPEVENLVILNFSCSLDPRHPHQYKHSHLHHHYNYVHRHRN